MRWQKLTIGYTSLTGLLAGRDDIWHRMKSNLPDDTKIVSIASSERAGCFTLTIASSEFDDLDEGVLIPEFPFSMTISVPTIEDHLRAIYGERA